MKASSQLSRRAFLGSAIGLVACAPAAAAAVVPVVTAGIDVLEDSIELIIRHYVCGVTGVRKEHLVLRVGQIYIHGGG